MKKLIAMLLAIIMIVMSFAGCGQKTNKLTGSWAIESVEVDGTVFTAAELNAMDSDNWMSKSIIILKDGGKAYVAEGGVDGVIIDWAETDNGTVIIGDIECTITDGLLAMVVDDDMTYFFKKVSDSQTIGAQETEESDETHSETEAVDDITIKTSPDKYTWYIKNYVGKNCASFGYTSLSGNRMDHYGAGYIELVFITPDGSYIDIETDDDLKEYVVTAQSLSPNTEMKYTFQTDSDGNEYDSLVATQSYEEIVLCVKKVGSKDEITVGLTEIKASADKYTYYIRDYTGRNLASCGYLSMSGERMDHYGAGYIRFVIVSTDGSFIDPEDTELLKNYVIANQNIAPNTELKFEFMTDSNGDEYDSLIQSQNIEEIEITVKPINGN